jgi:hypothetical protein
VCLLGSVALGYRRFYGEAQCEYGHVRGTLELLKRTNS